MTHVVSLVLIKSIMTSPNMNTTQYHLCAAYGSLGGYKVNKWDGHIECLSMHNCAECRKPVHAICGHQDDDKTTCRNYLDTSNEAYEHDGGSPDSADDEMEDGYLLESGTVSSITISSNEDTNSQTIENKKKRPRKPKNSFIP